MPRRVARFFADRGGEGALRDLRVQEGVAELKTQVVDWIALQSNFDPLIALALPADTEARVVRVLRGDVLQFGPEQRDRRAQTTVQSFPLRADLDRFSGLRVDNIAPDRGREVRLETLPIKSVKMLIRR